MATDSKYGKLEIPGIGEDEPVFIIRAKDATALPTINGYREFNVDNRRWTATDAKDAIEDLEIEGVTSEQLEGYLSHLPTGKDTPVPSAEWKDSFDERVFPAFVKWQIENADAVRFAD